jgi:hypothetical protein
VLLPSSAAIVNTKTADNRVQCAPVSKIRRVRDSVEESAHAPSNQCICWRACGSCVCARGDGKWHGCYGQ